MFDKLLPVVSLVIGIILTELFYWSRLRRDDRKNIGLLISYLLEIRHEIKSLNLFISEIKKRGILKPEAEIKLKVVFDYFIPRSVELHKKYDDAVDLVSKIDPILGFQLRAKNQFIPMIHKLRMIASEKIDVALLFNKMENTIKTEYLKIIEQTLLELAKRNSRKTKSQIIKKLNEKEKIPEELEELFSLIK